MKKFVMSLLLVFSGLVLAHGPTPQKVEKEVVIKADAGKVWGLIKDFGNWQKWHPAIESIKTEIKKEEGNNVTYRVVNLKEGGSISEKLRNIDDQAMQLKYEITGGVLPVADYNSKIFVHQGKNAGEVVVTWMGRFYRLYKLNPPIPAGQDDETAIKSVTGVYETGLAGLKKIAEGK